MSRAGAKGSRRARGGRAGGRGRPHPEVAAAAFVDRLERAERSISEVVAQLQRSPSHKAVAAARATLSSLGAMRPTGLAPAEPVEPEPLAVGDRVRLDKVGVVGRVISVGDALQVRTHTGLTLRDDLQDATRLGGAPPARPTPRRKEPLLPARRSGGGVGDPDGDRLA